MSVIDEIYAQNTGWMRKIFIYQILKKQFRIIKRPAHQISGGCHLGRVKLAEPQYYQEPEDVYFVASTGAGSEFVNCDQCFVYRYVLKKGDDYTVLG
jgi:hypothetical protein